MTKLFWIDMEMTGLDIEKEVIIETAAVITDMNFKTLADYQAIVKQPQKYLDAMDDWNKRTHGESGLTAKVPHGKDPSAVEDELIWLVDTHFKDEKPVLAGNSIHQDRLFIDKYFKRFSARLHYRMLDVTSWKVIMFNKFGIKTDKKGTHRALDDIFESISELSTYVSYVRQP